MTPWLGRFADAETRTAFADHRRSLYRNTPDTAQKPNLLPLRAGLGKARRRWLEQTSDDEWSATHDLPDLNPPLDARWPVSR
ncbi:hypothetical protein D3C72_1817430 [compost metagenome]